MNRRGFLGLAAKALVAAAATTVFDPEKLLWVPGARTHFDLWKRPHFACDRELGLAIRFVQQYDLMTDRCIARIDTFFGSAAFRDDLIPRGATVHLARSRRPEAYGEAFASPEALHRWLHLPNGTLTMAEAATLLREGHVDKVMPVVRPELACRIVSE